MRCELRVTSGSLTGRRVWVRDGQTVQVGRTEYADLCISDDPLMSRVHFAMDSDGGMLRIRDLGSRNGTYVNGQLIKIQELNHGDLIVAGQTRFDVVVDRSEGGGGQSAPSQTGVGQAPQPGGMSVSGDQYAAPYGQQSPAGVSPTQYPSNAGYPSGVPGQPAAPQGGGPYNPAQGSIGGSYSPPYTGQGGGQSSQSGMPQQSPMAPGNPGPPQGMNPPQGGPYSTMPPNTPLPGDPGAATNPPQGQYPSGTPMSPFTTPPPDAPAGGGAITPIGGEAGSSDVGQGQQWGSGPYQPSPGQSMSGSPADPGEITMPGSMSGGPQGGVPRTPFDSISGDQEASDPNAASRSPFSMGSTDEEEGEETKIASPADYDFSSNSPVPPVPNSIPPAGATPDNPPQTAPPAGAFGTEPVSPFESQDSGPDELSRSRTPMDAQPDADGSNTSGMSSDSNSPIGEAWQAPEAPVPPSPGMDLPQAPGMSPGSMQTIAGDMPGQTIAGDMPGGSMLSPNDMGGSEGKSLDEIASDIESVPLIQATFSTPPDAEAVEEQSPEDANNESASNSDTDGPSGDATEGTPNHATMMFDTSLDESTMAYASFSSVFANVAYVETTSAAGLRCFQNHGNKSSPPDIAKSLIDRNQVYLFVNLSRIDPQSRSMLESNPNYPMYTRVSGELVVICKTDPVDLVTLVRDNWGRDAIVIMVTGLMKNEVIKTMANNVSSYSYPSVLHTELERTPPEKSQSLFQRFEALMVEVPSTDGWKIFLSPDLDGDWMKLGMPCPPTSGGDD